MVESQVADHGTEDEHDPRKRPDYNKKALGKVSI